MKIKAEEIIGLGAIVFLLIWIWMHKQVSAADEPSVSLPPFPPGSIYNFPPAPDLNNFKLTGPNVPKFLRVPGPATSTTPSPCSCACDNGGASNQVTMDLSGFTKSLQSKMGDAFDTYLKNITDALPPYYKQFLDVGPGLQNASKIAADQINQIGRARSISTKVLGVVYEGDSQVYSNYNVNEYVAGRQAVFSTAMSYGATETARGGSTGQLAVIR